MANYGLKLGELYYEKTEFHLAQDVLREFMDYYSRDDLDSYLKSLNILLSIYNEQRDVAQIDKIKEEKLQGLYSDKKFKTHDVCYTMGLCETYRGNYREAIQCFEESLNMVLSQNKKEAICPIVIGLSIAYMELHDLDEALKEITTLQVFFQVLDLPKVKFMSELVHGRILHKMGKHHLALNIFEKCYESLNTQKNLYTFIQLLYCMGMAYLKQTNLELAYWHLSLAQKMIDPKILIRLHDGVAQALKLLPDDVLEEFDLIFSESLGTLIERHKGEVNIKNQAILMNMLRLFLSHPGEVYSKEKIVSNIWRQDYDPCIHDNKIYVTIKRLKQIIEPNYDKPRYIFRSKKGYFLNKNTKIGWHSGK